MAALGSIARQHSIRYSRIFDISYAAHADGTWTSDSFPHYSGVTTTYRESIPPNSATLPATWSPPAENCSLSGIVTENSVAVPQCLVFLFWRPTGQVIDSQWTDASGAFSFDRLDGTSTKYFVVALDPDGGTQYNAIIFDRLTPL